jgi:hypothetical protein
VPETRHRWFSDRLRVIVALTCLALVMTLPIVESVHTHKTRTTDCTICVAAHFVKAPAAAQHVAISERSLEASPLLNVRHSSVVLTDNVYIRPPPSLA